MGRLFDFLKRYFHVITFVVLQVAALVMLSYSMNYPHYALARLTKSITAPVNHLCFNVVRHFNLNSENEALVKQNLQLLQDQDDNFLVGDDSSMTLTLRNGSSTFDSTQVTKPCQLACWRNSSRITKVASLPDSLGSSGILSAI